MRSSGKLPRMDLQQTFEWDVLAHPTLIEWFDALRDVGWYRDPSVPGVKTPHGTIEYLPLPRPRGRASAHNRAPTWVRL